MKKISVLVKQVLMSTLTAGMFAVSFTACSDDSDLMSENNAADNGFIAGGSQLQKPIGLVYTDFINSNDVQILNADTTIISVNKAYADKMGITNFVNHPMGIWQIRQHPHAPPTVTVSEPNTLKTTAQSTPWPFISSQRA